MEWNREERDEKKRPECSLMCFFFNITMWFLLNTVNFAFRSVKIYVSLYFTSIAYVLPIVPVSRMIFFNIKNKTKKEYKL